MEATRPGPGATRARRLRPARTLVIPSSLDGERARPAAFRKRSAPEKGLTVRAALSKARGGRLPPTTRPAGAERDGIRHERRGEGSNHKTLRLWIAKNPRRVRRAYVNFETDTEVVLESADRVNVVYYGPTSTVVIEVKSLDSNDEDLRRGIFQCIKYRAVMEVMDMRSNAQVIPMLVTQTPLPVDLAALARRHGIRHFKAPTEFE